MSLIPFPNIPKVPGVPSIPRSPNFPPAASAALGLVQGLLWRVFQVQTRWGIWDSTGKPLGDPSIFGGMFGNVLDAAGLGSTLSTGSIDYSKETRVSDFPVESGGFANYCQEQRRGTFQESEIQCGVAVGVVQKNYQNL